jgi:Holliday junction resolvasome RuvABC endonuclease subunit
MKLLALDLGTATGWAVGEVDRKPVYGTEGFALGRFDGGGMRFLRFQRWLEEVLQGVDQLAYEEVRRHLGTDAAHVYGGLQAILTKECELRAIPYQAVPVGTIKRFATGRGNASKQDMLAAITARGYLPLDDNAADAIALWLLTAEPLSKTGPSRTSSRAPSSTGSGSLKTASSTRKPARP